MRRFQRVMGALNRQALFTGFPAERCGAAFKKEIGVAVSEVFEIMMIVSFGISWPMNVMKSYKARTTRGKSLSFLIFILVGYVCGITSKLLANTFKWYVMFFYVLNFVMVFADLLLYIRNYRLDKAVQASPQLGV